MVDRRLRPHDSNQLELKLAYVLEPGQRSQHYRVETYMFIPRTLGVTRESYAADRFYEDTAAFVRLKTPTVALAALAREDQAVLWFDRLCERLDDLLAGQASADGSATRLLKLLGAIYRSAMRDESTRLVRRVEDLAAGGGLTTPGREAEVARALDRFLDDMEGALERFRRVGSRCEYAAMDDEVREVWHAVDEYVALFAEQVCTRFVEVIDDNRDEAAFGDDTRRVRARLADAAVACFHYRRGRGYPSYARPGEENESLPYRSHILKRIASSALYLDLRHEEPGTFTHDAIGMTAAALAMLFAVLVTLWAQQQWDMFSGAFVAAMVVSYMVKDRIKEWGKRYLGRGVSRFIPDHVIQVRDPDSGKVIGQCREAFTIVSPSQVDQEIRELRHVDHPTTVATDGRPETVLRYRKEVTLSSDALQRRVEGIEGLNDIIRFNLSRLRERMDAPREIYRMVDPDTRELTSVACARVYHVNLVLRFITGRGASSRTEVERVRVILDQRGIKRIEPVRVGALVGASEPSSASGDLVDAPEAA
ncbi:MAG: hypothetical protein ACQEXJ_23270 [Myxococcota bacterium]